MKIKPPTFAPTFVPTKYDSGADKAKFANKLARFLVNGCPRTQFNKPLYKRLTFCFHHIAHTSIEGFYGTWFSTAVRRAAFLENLLAARTYGDPRFTFCDVEAALQAWLRETPELIEQFGKAAEVEINAAAFRSVKACMKVLTSEQRKELLEA